MTDFDDKSAEVMGLFADSFNLEFGVLKDFSQRVAKAIQENASQGATEAEWKDQQAMCVVEEAGEFIASYRKNRGFARTFAPREDVLAELADVVISSLLMFAVLGEDAEEHVIRKLRKVVTRGFVNKD